MNTKKLAASVGQSILTGQEKQTAEATPIGKNLLSTGSTLLNLACSGNPFGGFLKGRFYLLVGDSASGKTFFSMSCFAEAMRSKRFKDYRLIYDNVEDGMLMDVERLFGKKAAERIEPPKVKNGEPIFSYLIEEFYYHLDDAVKKGKPFIYVLDSMDGLSSGLEDSKFTQHKNAHQKGTAAAGSYGDGKAKKNSEGLRKALNGLRKTGSILIVISQTRDNFGFGFETKTHAGGRALRFYTTVEIWSSILGSLKKDIHGIARKVGVRIKLDVKKNRITGKTNSVESIIYPSYGIDDIGTCVDYLVKEQWWGKEQGLISAKEFSLKDKREAIIKWVESNGKEKELKTIVGQCWNDVEEACALKRQPKY